MKKFVFFGFACFALAATVLIAQDDDAAKREKILKDQSTAADKVKLDGKPAELAKGRELFEKNCSTCHIFGAINNNSVGPDLTTVSSRFKKRDILESVLFPSRQISDQYQAQIIETVDGDIFNGIITRQTAAAIQFRTGESEKLQVVSKAKIKEMRPSTVSIMPEGLLDPMTADDIANLVGFLQSPAP